MISYSPFLFFLFALWQFLIYRFFFSELFIDSVAILFFSSVHLGIGGIFFFFLCSRMKAKGERIGLIREEGERRRQPNLEGMLASLSLSNFLGTKDPPG